MSSTADSHGLRGIFDVGKEKFVNDRYTHLDSSDARHIFAYGSGPVRTLPVHLALEEAEELRDQKRSAQRSMDFESNSITETINRSFLGMTVLEFDDPKETFLASMSTIHRLPAELLTHIFGFALPKRVFWRRRSAPLNLSHVCLTWRNVALASSTLWTGLCVDVFRHSKPHVLPALITSWSRRSTSIHSLSLSLANHISYGSLTEGLTRPIIPLLSRFTELRFEKVNFRSLIPFIGLRSGSLPKLEVLALDIDSTVFDNVAPITVFGDTPRLRSALIGIWSPIIADESHFIFPWRQLTTLCLKDGIALHTFSKIIVQCLCLQRGCFVLSSRNDLELPEPVVPTDMVTFKALSELTIVLSKFWDPSGLTDVLSMFDLPAIDALCLESSQGSCAFPLVSIHPSRRSVLSCIRTLEMLSPLDIEDEVFDLLFACPFLESLSLRADTTRTQKSLLRRLHNGTTGPLYHLPLSHLTSFSLQIVATAEVQSVAEALFKLVHAWVKRRGQQWTLKRSMLEVVSLSVYDPRTHQDTITFIHEAFHYLRRGFESFACTDEDGMIKFPVPVLLDTKVLDKRY